MRLKSIALATLLFVSGLAAVASAAATSLVVYPITSQDALLGIAVSDRIATAFADNLEVYGPEVAPALLPPVTVSGGFINPSAFLGQDGFASITGATLLRDGTDADLVVSGRIAFVDDELELELFVVGPQGASRQQVRAPQDQPGLLAAKAVALLAQRLELERPQLARALDLSGDYGELVRGLALVGGGLLDQAAAVLATPAERDARARALLADVEAVLAGSSDGDPVHLATMSLSRNPFDEPLAIRYFEAFAEVSSLAAPELWLGALNASVNDRQGALAALEAVAERFDYGRAALAAYRVANDLADDSELLALAGSSNSAALLAVASAANSSGNVELEKLALRRLTRVAPTLVYPFERLSFIAFDEDDALAAAEALSVAVQLEPDSDLYWTNLGWSYYLLGFLDRSEEASIRAVELDPRQYIALYNLGLVRAVTGRLEEAMPTYFDALRQDPEVDDEAIHDLENALELFPDEPGIHFALATLYEAEGRRAEAADQFELYLQRGGTAFADQAASKVEALRAPPPPIEISPEVTLSLGAEGPTTTTFHPQDLLYPAFEIFTPGDELPSRLEVAVKVRDASGNDVAESQETVEVPPGAIGFVINRFGIELPAELEPGDYQAVITVSARDERTVEAAVPFTVEGQPELVRQLLGRNIVMQELASGAPLYDERDLARPERLIDVLVSELRATADAAEGALPVVSEGRFEGLSGGELFRQSTAEDVRDFLEFLLAQGTTDATFTFVEAYAQWALDGAPTVE